MDLIIDWKYLSFDKIKIKNGKNSQKILYTVDDVYLIGIPLKFVDFSIVKQTNKLLIIDILDSEQIQLLNRINSFFSDKYQIPYEGFIKEGIISIKKTKLENYTNTSELYLSIHNIKMKNSFITIQLFTI
jgi:hypothetical protein